MYKEKRIKLHEDKEKEKEKDKESYSFKPKLEAKYQSQKLKERGSAERISQNRIFEELYQKKERKQDIATVDFEFEKNKVEYTFKPNTRQSSRVSLKIMGDKPRQSLMEQ